MDVNNSTHAYESQRRIPPIPIHTTIALYSILLVCSLLGNVLVILVVYCNQNLRTNMNYLIVNMAASDLLVPLVAMPWRISIEKLRPSEWLVDGPLGDALCKLVPLLSYIPPTVSSISLAIIAFQRFVVVVYPTRRPILTRKKRWIVISFPWIVAMALYSSYFYTYRLTNEYLGYKSCYRSWLPPIDPFTADTIVMSLITMIGFVIPSITIILLYSILFYKLRESLKNVIPLIERETIRSRQQRNRRIFCMSVNIIAAFIICWCPLVAFQWMRQLNHPLVRSTDFELLHEIWFGFNYMWYSLATINPCIYFVFLGDFRQGLKTIFDQRRRKTQDVPEPEIERVTRTQHTNHLTSIPLQSIERTTTPVEPEPQAETVTRTQHDNHLPSIPFLSIGRTTTPGKTEPQVEIVTRTQHTNHLTSIPLYEKRTSTTSSLNC